MLTSARYAGGVQSYTAVAQGRGRNANGGCKEEGNEIHKGKVGRTEKRRTKYGNKF